jgi:hypothetical protein
VGIHDVGDLQAVLEDEVEHRVDHLQLGVHEGRLPRCGSATR